MHNGIKSPANTQYITFPYHFYTALSFKMKDIGPLPGSARNHEITPTAASSLEEVIEKYLVLFDNIVVDDANRKVLNAIA